MADEEMKETEMAASSGLPTDNEAEAVTENAGDEQEEAEDDDEGEEE